MRPARRPRFGTAAAFAAVLAFAAVPPMGGAARAQSAANPNDQPTAGTLPPGTSTVTDDAIADRPSGNVPPPSRIRPSTTVGNGGAAPRTNPLDHLPPNYRTRSGTDE